MITKNQVDLAKVIFLHLETLYAETKKEDSNEHSQKDLLTGICIDVNELSAQLHKIWRDVR